MPFFATQRVDSTVVAMDQQTDPPNVQLITAHTNGTEVDAYFGCWLDTNQPFKLNGVTPNNVLPIAPPATNINGPFTDPENPPLTIQQAIQRNSHQCLIAEIAFDQVVIPVGKDPSNYDKLAQRNLNVVGVASPHLVPYTFDIKPSAANLPPDQMPDELMIDWGNVPAGSKASIYLPALNAQSILSTADRLYSHHELSRLDDHTLGCKAAGISYIPIPSGTASNHAGLMTIDVPPTVRKGQTFKVVTRQITNTFSVAPGAQMPPEIGGVPKVAAVQDVIKWRKVLGSFQLTIPVQTKDVLLEPEQRLLSVLRWISRSIPQDNRWRPVFDRYLEQIEGRVDAL